MITEAVVGLTSEADVSLFLSVFCGRRSYDAVDISGVLLSGKEAARSTCRLEDERSDWLFSLISSLEPVTEDFDAAFRSDSISILYAVLDPCFFFQLLLLCTGVVPNSAPDWCSVGSPRMYAKSIMTCSKAFGRALVHG